VIKVGNRAAALSTGKIRVLPDWMVGASLRMGIGEPPARSPVKKPGMIRSTSNIKQSTVVAPSSARTKGIY